MEPSGRNDVLLIGASIGGALAVEMGIRYHPLSRVTTEAITNILVNRSSIFHGVSTVFVLLNTNNVYSSRGYLEKSTGVYHQHFIKHPLSLNRADWYVTQYDRLANAIIGAGVRRIILIPNFCRLWQRTCQCANSVQFDMQGQLTKFYVLYKRIRIAWMRRGVDMRYSISHDQFLRALFVVYFGHDAKWGNRLTRAIQIYRRLCRIDGVHFSRPGLHAVVSVMYDLLGGSDANVFGTE